MTFIHYVPDAVMEAVKARNNADAIFIYGSTESWWICSRSLYYDNPKGGWINVKSSCLHSYSCLPGKILIGRENL